MYERPYRSAAIHEVRLGNVRLSEPGRLSFAKNSAHDETDIGRSFA